MQPIKRHRPGREHVDPVPPAPVVEPVAPAQVFAPPDPPSYEQSDAAIAYALEQMRAQRRQGWERVFEEYSPAPAAANPSRVKAFFWAGPWHGQQRQMMSGSISSRYMVPARRELSEMYNVSASASLSAQPLCRAVEYQLVGRSNTEATYVASDFVRETGLDNERDILIHFAGRPLDCPRCRTKIPCPPIGPQYQAQDRDF